MPAVRPIDGPNPQPDLSEVPLLIDSLCPGYVLSSGRMDRKGSTWCAMPSRRTARREPEDRNVAGPSNLIARLWGRQEPRFLIVGAGNTLSGYGVSSLIYFLLHAFTPLLVIILICTVLNITVSCLTNKLLVFRRRGNYLAEYLSAGMVSRAARSAESWRYCRIGMSASRIDAS